MTGDKLHSIPVSAGVPAKRWKAAMTSSTMEVARERVDEFTRRVTALRECLHRVVVGQDQTIDLLLTCALTGSHALLMGVPGLAKTLMVKALACAFDWKFSRVQFTPDLMPSDITGYELLAKDGANGSAAMVFRRGPVFANLVLADEINRAAPKTQSALLEAMAERHVTVGGQTYPLEKPFLVVATQNPIEQEGTYPLPEAQLDRFMMEIRVAYPQPEQEEEIVLKTTAGEIEMPAPVFDRQTFLDLRDLVWSVPVPKVVAAYAVRLCGSSRPDDSRAHASSKNFVAWGAGPRGSQNLVLAAKAHALLLGRTAPTFQDVQKVALPVLRHRILVNYRAIGEGVTSETVVDRLLKDTPT
jgi:MoxR-like ATPase